MPGRMPTSDDLTALLERFPLERAGPRTVDEATDAQLQLLLGRLAALTDLCRDAADTEIGRMASRLLLSDLSTVAALFRGRVNTLESQLANVLTEVRGVLAQTDVPQKQP